MSSLSLDIPGLTIQWTKIGASLYANVVHVPSGLFLLRFDKAPLPFGKKELIRRIKVNLDLSQDWTESFDSVSQDRFESLRDMLRVCRGKVLG